jgi:Protein of unknown function (DUF4239)
MIFLGGAAVVVALIAGLVLRRVARRDIGEPDTVMADLAAQGLTLAILFLAFVLVDAAESYTRASAAATAEADVVDHIYELAEFAPEPQRRQLTAATVCYARAIVHHEWSTMDRGRSAVASGWSTRLRRVFAQMPTDSNLFEMLVKADSQRSQARRDRITEQTTSTPDLVIALMIGSLAVSVGAMAFAIPRRRPGHAATLVAVVLLLVATLLLIEDLERPFTGLASVGPEAIVDAAADDSEDYRVDYPQVPLPCDDTGAILPRSGHAGA